MKKLLILLLTFTGLQLGAQNINKYKYVVVPESYDFLGEINQYQLNALTKYLFEQNGFETVMRTEAKPKDLQNDPCLGLAPNLVEDSGLFTTKIILQLKDCYGNVVFATKEGTSRSKDYKKAYQESLRAAFKDIQNLDYNYKPASVENKEVANRVEEKPNSVVEAEVKEKSEVLIEEKEEVEEEEKKENDILEYNLTEEDVETLNKETDTSEAYSENSEKIYLKDGSRFSLKSTDQGFALYPENSPEPIALLIATDNSGFIYNSLSQQGVASFDEDQNLVVEYFSRSENKKIKITYRLQD